MHHGRITPLKLFNWCSLSNEMPVQMEQDRTGQHSTHRSTRWVCSSGLVWSVMDAMPIWRETDIIICTDKETIVFKAATCRLLVHFYDIVGTYVNVCTYVRTYVHVDKWQERCTQTCVDMLANDVSVSCFFYSLSSTDLCYVACGTFLSRHSTTGCSTAAEHRAVYKPASLQDHKNL